VLAARDTAAVLAVAVALAAAPGRAAGPSGDFDGLLPAPARTAYSGRKVVIDFTSHGPQVTSMSVVCQPGGRERREMRATHGVLIVDGESAWQYFPERGIVVKRPARGEGGELQQPEQVRRALASYTLQVVPVGLVAGRASRALEFVPRRVGTRPRRLVWVDAETGLILRTEVYGTDNRLSRLSMFEELDYHPVLDASAFRMQVPAGVRVIETDAGSCVEPAEAGRLAWLPVPLPAYMPDGFARQCIRARRERDYGEIQVVYGDGLTVLSLFASTSFREPAGNPHHAVAAADAGTGVSGGRWYQSSLVNGLAWRAPWAYLALLGELSRPELARIAESVGGQPELSPVSGRR
jgi:outer membrane lipoprotein-sorting protein